MANAPTDESRSDMPKLQSRMRWRRSFENPETHSWYRTSTSVPRLTNRYDARRRSNWFVVGVATTYNWGMTIPDSKTTPAGSDYHIGSAGRKLIGQHWPAEKSQLEISRWANLGRNHLQSQQASMEKSQPMHLEIKWQANSENYHMDTKTSDSEHTWRRSGKHTWRKASEQLEMISTPSTGRILSVSTCAPPGRMISATATAPERRWNDQGSLTHAERV